MVIHIKCLFIISGLLLCRAHAVPDHSTEPGRAPPVGQPSQGPQHGQLDAQPGRAALGVRERRPRGVTQGRAQPDALGPAGPGLRQQPP
ncbi:MAG TPA: hypothetical protein DD420_13865, partial [Streptomyces sp.]|nr:hypothetical protein [Streptomyces sp.]